MAVAVLTLTLMGMLRTTYAELRTPLLNLCVHQVSLHLDSSIAKSSAKTRH